MGGNSARGCALFGPTKSIRAGEELFACDSLCFGSLRFATFARVKADAARRPRQGLPAELLWNAGFSDCPRGLAAVVDPDDEIVEVTSDTTPILKCRRDLLSFRRHIA
jgi:hypothetical protein